MASFGLWNAPAMFQSLTNMVVSGIEGYAVYLDDVVIYSNTWKDHVHHIRKLFDRLCAVHLTINLAKHEFAKATVTYLGKVVGKRQVEKLQQSSNTLYILPRKSSCVFLV